MARLRRLQMRSKRSTALPEISLTPLIDTVLVLLVVFMMTTPIMHNFINIELPTSSTKDPAVEHTPETSITVTIDKTGKLFINDTPIKKDKFMDELEKRLAHKQDQVVFVNADKAIAYGAVVAIVDDIKYLGGVKYVALSTQNA